MGKEIERRIFGKIQRADPDQGADVEPFVAPSVPISFDVPTYLMLRPPETGGKWQDAWASNPLVLALRAGFRFGLWITEYWWRPTIAFLAIAALVALFIFG